MPDQTSGRRAVLRATGLTAIAAVAGCVTGSGGDSAGGDGTGTDVYDEGNSTFGGGGTDSPTPTETPAQSATESTESAGGGSNPTFDGWLSGVDNYDGVTDETDSDTVSVEVGVDNGGQPLGFGPAAITVSTGTKVTWTWTGKGGSHNVLDQDGAFESELLDDEGHTFSHTFESTGTYKYSCQPHKTLGMKAVVVVE